MFNQIRAEFYKLFHTKALYLTFALILAVFGIFSIGGQQQFVVSSSSLDGTWKIGETVGFLARAYSDTAHPMIEYLQFLIGKYMDLAQADEEQEEREHEIYLEYPEYYEDEGILEEEEKWLEEFLNQLPENKREYFERLIKESQSY